MIRVIKCLLEWVDGALSPWRQPIKRWKTGEHDPAVMRPYLSVPEETTGAPKVKFVSKSGKAAGTYFNIDARWRSSYLTEWLFFTKHCGQRNNLPLFIGGIIDWFSWLFFVFIGLCFLGLSEWGLFLFHCCWPSSRIFAMAKANNFIHTIAPPPHLVLKDNSVEAMEGDVKGLLRHCQGRTRLLRSTRGHYLLMQQVLSVE